MKGGRDARFSETARRVSGIEGRREGVMQGLVRRLGGCLALRDEGRGRCKVFETALRVSGIEG